MFRILLFVFILLANFLSVPETSAEESPKKLFVGFLCSCDLIEFRVEQVSGLEKNKNFSEAQIQQALRRLEKLQLYYRIERKTLSRNRFAVALYPKWSLIPVIKASGGGGGQSLTLGLFDANPFQSLIEVGFQWEQFSGNNSYVVWSRYPGFFSPKNLVGASYWSMIQSQALYDQSSLSLLAVERREDQKIRFFWERELTEYISIQPYTEWKQQNLDGTTTLPSSYEQAQEYSYFLSGLKIIWSNLSYDSWKIEGSEIVVDSSYGAPLKENIDTFWSSEVQVRHFESLAHNGRWLWANRLKLSYKKTRNYLEENFIGGLFDLRGLLVDQFYGSSLYLANTEVRWAFIHSPDLVAQLVPFVDLGRAASSIASKPALSSGLGLRAVFPKYYRLSFRVDYAKLLNFGKKSEFSFGLQQFF